MTEGALAKAPEAASSPARPETIAPTMAPALVPTVDTLQNAIVAALADGGHGSAAQLLGTGTWIVDGTTLRIEAPGVGKKMISLTVNAGAEKIMRQELAKLGGPGRFMVVPGTGTAQATPAAAAQPAGGIQQAALAHPMVERARELFKAEVRSVVDLRPK